MLEKPTAVIICAKTMMVSVRFQGTATSSLSSMASSAVGELRPPLELNFTEDSS